MEWVVHGIFSLFQIQHVVQGEYYVSKRGFFSKFRCVNSGSQTRATLKSVLNFVGRVPSCSCLRGYFVGSEYFLVGISWVQSLFSWVFRGSKIFSRGYFAVPKFSLVGNFVTFSCWPHETYLKLRILFQIDFNSCEFCLCYKDTSSTKLLMLLRSFKLCWLYF